MLTFGDHRDSFRREDGINAGTLYKKNEGYPQNFCKLRQAENIDLRQLTLNIWDTSDDLFLCKIALDDISVDVLSSSSEVDKPNYVIEDGFNFLTFGGRTSKFRNNSLDHSFTFLALVEER